MKIRFILSMFAFAALAFLVIVTPLSAQVTNGGEDFTTSTEDTSTSITNGGEDATLVAPVNGEGYTSINNGSDDAVGINPDATNTTVNNGGEDTVNVAPTVSSLTVTNVNDTPVSTTNSGGGSSSSGRRSVVPVKPASVVALSVQGLSCPVVTSQLLKVGGSNDSADVTRLQSFLKNVEKLDVEINGTYDAKTEDAVKAFQLKYKDTILAPWKATKASGVAYITTIKKINELACGNQLVITPAELAVIDAYNKKIGTNTTVNTSNGTSDNDVIGATNNDTQNASGTSVAVSEEVNASSTDSEENTAAASDAPVLKRFWGFVVGLFR